MSTLKRVLRKLAKVGGIIVLLIAGCELYRPTGPDGRTLEGRAILLARGEEIRAGLERYRAKYGHYPRELSSIDVKFHWSDRAHGGWGYTQVIGGNGYYLRLGDYLLDGFVLYRSSRRSEWDWDT